MDPISIIVLALAAGAAAGLKPTAENAIKDAYAGVKALIQRKYAKVDLTPLEQKPESTAKRESLREDLAEAGAGDDLALLDQVEKLLDVLEKHGQATATAIGIDIKEVKAGALKIRQVTAEGTGIKLERSEFAGDIDIGEVKAGNVRDSENPQARQ